MATEFPIRANTQGAERDIDELIAALRKAGVQAGLTEKEINEITTATRRAKDEGSRNVGDINKGFNNLNQTIKNVGTTILAAFAFDQIVEFGRKVVEVTSEFQKFEAVLTNTLGSQSQAQRALAQIREFAAKTPFSVRELTESFVKLANQGFKPTADQMRRLGDVAAATGKQFDQLTEAIIDAQTGEFERLKEFGIRAAKEGDNVTFTFKGVETQVKFTAESIREYITGLGDAEGVSGAMAAISETLGGKISNLGDTFDQLLNTIGNNSTGGFAFVIEILNGFLEETTRRLESADEAAKNFSQNFVTSQLRQFEAYASAFQDVDRAQQLYIEGLERERQEINDKIKALHALEEPDYEQINRLERRSRLLVSEVIPAIEEYVEELKEENKIKADAAARKAEEERLKRLAKEAELRKKINDQRVREANSIESRNIPVEQQSTLPIGSNIDQVLNPGQVTLDSLVPQANPEQDPEMIAFFDKEQYKQALMLESFDFAVSLTNTLADIQRSRYQEEASELEAKRDYELSLAGDNADAKMRINKQYDAQLKRLQRDQAERERRAATISTIINTAAGVIQALRQPPGPPGTIPFGLFMGAQGALQLAAINSAPRFAKGVFDLDGPGTGTSDSINAWLSRGESVVPADRTQKFSDIVKPIVENDYLDYADLKRIVDSKVPNLARAGLYVMPAVRDDGELVQEIRATRKAIENKKEFHWNITEKGLELLARQGEQWDTYVNKRYRS